MEPAFQAGDRLIVNRYAYLRRAPRLGEIIVFRDPEHHGRWLLKRVARPPEATIAHGVYVLGDNARESRDSRQFGAIDPSAVIGKVWRKY
jgi:signal peptidase I